MLPAKTHFKDKSKTRFLQFSPEMRQLELAGSARSCKTCCHKNQRDTFLEKVKIAFSDGFGCDTTWEGNQSSIKSFTFLPHNLHCYPFLFNYVFHKVWFHTLISFVQIFSFPVLIFLFLYFCIFCCKNVSGCTTLSLLKLTQSRKCKILQCDEYQIAMNTKLWK